MILCLEAGAVAQNVLLSPVKHCVEGANAGLHLGAP